MTLLPIDGPAEHTTISVTTTEVEAKAGASALEERKVVTIQPLDGRVRVLFESGVAASDGILVFKYQIVTFEATHQQPIYLRTESGTTEVVVVERA